MNGKTEGVARDFPKVNSRPHPRPDRKTKNPRCYRPRGFLAEGLAEDAAEGLREENYVGYFQSTPLGTNSELEGHPEGTDSPHYTRGFSTDCHSKQISTVNK